MSEILVNPVAELIDAWYHHVAYVTIRDPRPEEIEHDGRRYHFYAQTVRVGDPEPLLYREEMVLDG
jgi:hypothetical protein